jgi:membrane protease YdiL (CAAX protease family)
MLFLTGIAVGIGVLGIHILGGVIGNMFGVRDEPITITPGWVFADLVVAPLWEEIAFRGPVYFLSGNKLVWLIIGGMAIVYVVVHSRPFFFPQTEQVDGRWWKKRFLSLFLFGFLLGWLALETHSLVPGMICHSAWNGVVLLQSKLGWLQELPERKETM